MIFRGKLRLVRIVKHASKKGNGGGIIDRANGTAAGGAKRPAGVVRRSPCRWTSARTGPLHIFRRELNPYDGLCASVFLADIARAGVHIAPVRSGKANRAA